MWKFHNDYLPQSLLSNFNYNSRNQIIKSYSRLEPLKRFSLLTASNVWNDLPTSIKEKSTLKSFSDSVKKHFLNKLDNLIHLIRLVTFVLVHLKFDPTLHARLVFGIPLHSPLLLLLVFAHPPAY